MADIKLQRIARTENCYRHEMRKALIEVLKIINPADAIQYGAMKYEDLIVYARDWIQTEVDEVVGKIVQSEPTKFTLNESVSSFKAEDLVGGLSLED